ncbi:hypothetical protein S83_033062, partial [Arachis hypogaea]
IVVIGVESAEAVKHHHIYNTGFIIHLDIMRNLKIRSNSQPHSFIYEDPRIEEQRKILQQRVHGNRFVIREVPIQGLFNGEKFGTNNNDNNVMMDYDIPEFVVFIQEDLQQFVKDIGVDRVVTPEQNYCDLDHSHNNNDNICRIKSRSDPNLVRTMKRMSTISDGSECDFKHTSTKKRTSQTLEEIFRNDAEFSRPFKNWQLNSQLGTNVNKNKYSNNRVKHPNQCSCPYLSQFTNTTTMPPPIIIGSQIDDFPHQEVSSHAPSPLSVPILSSTTTTNSGSEASMSSINAPRHHHQSNDSISSTHSFAFPILPAEWSGSPVRMAEGEKRKSRFRQWWKIFVFPCFKCF